MYVHYSAYKRIYRIYKKILYNIFFFRKKIYSTLNDRSSIAVGSLLSMSSVISSTKSDITFIIMNMFLVAPWCDSMFAKLIPNTKENTPATFR